MKEKPSFIVHGLAGKRKLAGSVEIQGAKNAVLKAMSASILFDGPVTLTNVPSTADVRTMVEILKKLGAVVENKESEHTIVINPTPINSTVIDMQLAQSMRASVVLTGPLTARYYTSSFPAPGGCVIGARPIDLFLSGYEKMGATVREPEGYYEISAESGELIGAEITFTKISVGATETLMMAAVLANGTTTLNNCALEPEIVNVAEWLNACGAKIRGAGTPTIVIEGTNAKLLTPKVPFVTIPDRIEAGSYLILGALLAKKLKIAKCDPNHMEAVISLLRQSGADIEVGDSSLTVSNGDSRMGNIKSIENMKTHEYPGFPTDLQAPFVTYLTQAYGESTVLETIFEGRFKYVEELMRMGANITIMNPREVLIKGPTTLKNLPDGEELRAHDIRAGFAVVLAALLGDGTFRINNVELIDRGYEKLEEKLNSLGANIVRV